MKETYSETPRTRQKHALATAITADSNVPMLQIAARGKGDQKQTHQLPRYARWMDDADEKVSRKGTRKSNAFGQRMNHHRILGT